MDALNDDKDKLRIVSSNSRDDNSRSRSESTLSDRTLLNMSDSEADEKRRSGDVEKEGLIEQLPKVVTKEHATKDPYARAKILMWMFVNTVATVTIVSCPFHMPPTQSMLIIICPFIRSSVIKPSSAINPFHNVKQPLHPSTSSLQQLPCTSSLAPPSPCSSLGRFPS